MPALGQRTIVGAQAVVVDGRGRVLLQLRPWPAGWEPPGGHVGPGEEPSATVVRETREETGLEIEVERIIGYYRFTGLRHDTDIVFQARAVGGQLQRSREAWRLRWVEPDRMPRSLFPWYRQRIADALVPSAGAPEERVQPVGVGSVLSHGFALIGDSVGVLLPTRAGSAQR